PASPAAGQARAVAHLARAAPATGAKPHAPRVNAQAREYLDNAGARLRAMQERDLDQVVGIEQAAYDFPWTPGIFRDCLRGGYGCWVLDRGGVVIGYGVLNVAANEAHILNVCVAPEAQGEGHGRHLVRRLIDLA